MIRSTAVSDIFTISWSLQICINKSQICVHKDYGYRQCFETFLPTEPTAIAIHSSSIAVVRSCSCSLNLTISLDRAYAAQEVYSFWPSSVLRTVLSIITSTMSILRVSAYFRVLPKYFSKALVTLLSEYSRKWGVGCLSCHIGQLLLGTILAGRQKPPLKPPQKVSRVM